MALGEEACLFEGNGWADASAFADDADAAFGRAMIMSAVIKQHAASASGTFLFR